jgi:ADP-L-glycero-D-manno-heptose 6-epimerase
VNLKVQDPASEHSFDLIGERLHVISLQADSDDLFLDNMIIVTGGAGFVGSNLVKELNNRGLTNIIVVDDMTDGSKFRNLVDCKIADFIDASDFREMIRSKSFTIRPRAVFHYAAVSSTTAINGKTIININFTYSKELFHWCKDLGVRFIYASSAAVYGRTTSFDESSGMESPLTMFGYSKMLFDQYVLRNLDSRSPQIVGLRLFSVYGPNEHHKGDKASLAYQFYNIRKEYRVIKLFGDYDGVKGGEQKHDFVHVQDVARLNCWFLDHPEITGIFNVGTGVATTTHDLATLVAKHFGEPEAYIKMDDFPAELKGQYQSYTCANTAKLRRAGSSLRFRTVKEGVKEYMQWLEESDIPTKASLPPSKSSPKTPTGTPVKLLIK